jgi:endonuclease V-like protein UPF0215 family
MSAKVYSNVVAFDDGPFNHAHRGDVVVVGTVYAGLRLDGVLVGRVRRDGRNSTKNLAALVRGSRFCEHLQLVLLQGIALAGFNVVDVHELHERLGLPILVVARRRPNLRKIRQALYGRVPGGARKWRLIERAGEMEPTADLWVQRAGLDLVEARLFLERVAVCGRIPEPLRTAHLIAAAVTTGESRGRV